MYLVTSQDLDPSGNHVNYNNKQTNLNAGSPTGYDEVWCIGDTHLLSQARIVMEEMKDIDSFKSGGPKTRLPFIFENFEVFVGSYHHSWSFTSQMLGGLNYLLSTKWKLPNYIYIFFSNEQISDMELLGEEFFPVLKKLFTNINRAIVERKSILPKKAKRFKPPVMCVVRTVTKSEDQQNSKNFKLRRRALNRTLQKLATEFQWKSINIDSILPKQAENFDERGNDLSKIGYQLLWQFISNDLRTMEHGQAPDQRRLVKIPWCQRNY